MSLFTHPFSTIISFLHTIFKSLFGDISWKPPVWLRVVCSILWWPLTKIYTHSLNLRKANYKKWLFTNSVILLVLMTCTAYGYWWYIQPAPHRITFRINQPTPTPLEENAKPNPLGIIFSGSAASLDAVNKNILKGISVTPELPGTWKWSNDALIEFLPEQDWAVGKTYSIRFEKNLFASHVLLETYRGEFTSPSFIGAVKSGEFYEDPTNPQLKQAVVTLSFTHPVDKSSLERHISLKMRVDPVKSFSDTGIKSLGFKVVYNDKSTEAYIRSENISIPERDGEVLVQIDSGVLSARGGTPSKDTLTRTVHIPGIENYFKISQVLATTITDEKTYQAQRIITIESTAAVAQKELAAKAEVYLLSDNPELYRNLPEVFREVPNNTSVDEEEGESNLDASTYTPPYCPLQSAGQVTPKILAASKKLDLRWIPTPQDFSQFHSAAFEAPVGRCVFIRIQKGTKSFGEYPLVTERSFLADTQPFTPDVKIIGEGALLSVNGDKKISVMTRNLNAIRYRLFRILPNALHHLTTQTDSYNGTFAQPEFNYNFGPEQISEVFTSTQTLPPGDQGTPRYAAFDFTAYISSSDSTPRGLFILEASGWDLDGKYITGPTAKRLVLLTDLGLIVKEAQFGVRDLFVTSLSRGSGVRGASVRVLGKNGLPIFTGTTDDNGHLLIPSLLNNKFEKTPTVYVVELAGDLTFMPYEKRDRSLNFSRFDVGGLYTNSEEESLQSYIFSDRGIYRPGETAHIGIIVKRTDWAPLPDGVPFELTIEDPRGRTIRSEVIKIQRDGFVEHTFAVPESAITGTYTVHLSITRPNRIEALLGSTTLRVDEFLPDRLKIEASLSGESNGIWLSPDGLKGKVTLKNLFGTSAAGNTVRGSIRLTPLLPQFPNFKNFQFTDPYKSKNSFQETIGDVATNDAGEAEFDLNLSRFEKGIYQLHFIAEGFEKEGGRSVINSKTTIINPLPYLIGFASDGDRSFIQRDTTQTIRLIAINSNQEKTEAQNISLELIEKRYVSVLTKLESGSLAYQSVEKKELIQTESLTISPDGYSLTLPTKNPGNFIYVLKNSSGLVLSEIPFTVVGNANISGNLERNAELTLKLDRADYLPGQEIQIQIQAPYAGHGLITVERDKVYASKWFSTTTTSSLQTITLPEGIEGNGYVNVTFARSLDSREIYMSPLSYGVEPFQVSRSRHTHPISLTVPNMITPGAKLSITVSTPKKSKTAVYAIDEGILQVARYRTPDPLSHFYRKRALEVSTSQILDLLLPEYKILSQLSATGGDEDALLGRHKNPFKRKGQKPVVFWSGLLETSPQPATLDFVVPDHFNGSIKVFAVSVDQTSLGIAESPVTVQGDLVVSPSAPLVAAPGDTFQVSGIITNVRGASENTTIKIETSPAISVIGESTKSLLIQKGKDAVASFTLKAQNTLGNAEIKFIAQNGTAAVPSTVTISIRPATPLLTTIDSGFIKAGVLGDAATDKTISRSLFPELASQSISASTLPFGMTEGLRRYLAAYPNGCSEQISSQMYPNLIYLDRPELGISASEAQAGIERAFTILSSRQNEDGSFKIWPSYQTSDPLLSIHIIRFLVESRLRRIELNESMYNNAIDYLKTLANKPIHSLDEARNAAYAAYILTRDGHMTTNYLQAIYGALQKFNEPSWKNDLTALYLAASFMHHQMNEEAETLWKGFTPGAQKSADQYQDTLFRNAQYLLLTSLHFPEKVKNIPPEFLESVATEIAALRFNTISSSLAILALSEYQKRIGVESLAELHIETSSDGKTFIRLPLSQKLTSSGSLSLDTRSVRIKSSERSPVFYAITQSGFDSAPLPEIKNGIEVLREYRNSKGDPINSASLGDDIEVRIVLRAIEKPELIGDIAVLDLLPAGFELPQGSLSLAPREGETQYNRWYTHFVDAREDRALLYGTVGNDAVEYRYKVKAVSKGDFTVPPIQAESMYNQKFVARSAPSRFVVQ